MDFAPWSLLTNHIDLMLSILFTPGSCVRQTVPQTRQDTSTALSSNSLWQVVLAGVSTPVLQSVEIDGESLRGRRGGEKWSKGKQRLMKN